LSLNIERSPLLFVPLASATEMRVKAFEAFNIIKSESVLMLDCCMTSGPSLPGVVSIDKSLPVSEGAFKAQQFAVDNFGPDNPSRAIVFYANCDDGPGSDSRSEQVTHQLLSSGLCKQVLCVDRAEFVKQYSFVFDLDCLDASAYPSEILEGVLFLGSTLALEKQHVLDNIGITHVVSVIDRKVRSPACQQQLWCSIADDPLANLTPVMAKALPFIVDALAGGGRVLVHCEQGRSRSASVVVAHLMQSQNLDVDAALKLVQQQRPHTQPNSGFMHQLRRRAWDSSTPPSKRMCSVRNLVEVDLLQSGEPPPTKLTSWLTSKFFMDPQLPEQCVHHAKMGDWLQGDKDDITTKQLPQGLGTVVEGLLTRLECQRIIAETENLGYGYTNFPKQYRGNRRLQVDDATGAMAAKIWKRIRAHVPESLTVNWTPEDGDYPTGIWTPVGCNTRFRFSKYFPGDQFLVHVDNMIGLGRDRCCLLTVNVYLNDLEPGQCGRTRFYLERGGDPIGSTGGVAGNAVIFKQEHVVHDGEKLTSGLKYLMRTDVVFEKVCGGMIG